MSPLPSHVPLPLPSHTYSLPFFRPIPTFSSFPPFSVPSLLAFFLPICPIFKPKPLFLHPPTLQLSATLVWLKNLQRAVNKPCSSKLFGAFANISSFLPFALLPTAGQCSSAIPVQLPDFKMLEEIAPLGHIALQLVFYCTVALHCIFASCISSLLLCSVHIDTLSSSSSSLKWIRESSIRNKGWAPEEEMHKQILQWFLFALLPSSSSHLISLNKSVKVDVHRRNAPIMTLQIKNAILFQTCMSVVWLHCKVEPVQYEPSSFQLLRRYFSCEN